MGGSSFLSPEPGTILWTLITFGVLLTLLRLFAWKPILGMLDQREKTIKGALDDAKKARDEAEKHLAESREAMKKARMEMSAVIEKGQKDAERIRQEMLERAKKESDDLRQRGLEEIDRERRAAVGEIRKTAVDLAVSAAGRIIQSSMDEAAQRKLAAEFIDRMGEPGPPGKN